MFIKKKVILASTIKDVEQNLEKLFQIFKDINSLYEDYFIILVESDSSDSTYNKARRLINDFNGKVFKSIILSFTIFVKITSAVGIKNFLSEPFSSFISD